MGVSVSFATGLRCRECARAYPLSAQQACGFCFGPLEVVYDYEEIARAVSRESIAEGPTTMWRYAPLLPVSPEGAVSLGGGWTPLRRAPRLAEALGLGELWVKNDGANPTGSFKDRVVSVALSAARAMSYRVAACASTGNLANSVAAHAASAGMPAVVLVPADVEPAKLVATEVYGAQLVLVEGTYDQANRLAGELAAEHPDWAFVNVGLRAFYAEGSKTLAYEVAEQLGWEVPDHVVVPIGSGSQLTKIAKGFAELQAVGLVERGDVRISGAQAAGCAPVATAFAAGEDVPRPVKPNTVARSIAIGDPADGAYALHAVRQSGGSVVAVSDAEVVAGIRLLAETEGILTETAGGVTVAALGRMAASGLVRPEERVCLYVTGNGLKTVDALGDAVTEPLRVRPRVEAVEAALGGFLERVAEGAGGRPVGGSVPSVRPERALTGAWASNGEGR